MNAVQLPLYKTPHTHFHHKSAITFFTQQQFPAVPAVLLLSFVR
jgi:hypothetical protein